MFFPVGWPRVLNSSESNKINAVVCNRDKILFAVLTADALTIWYCKARNLDQKEFIIIQFIILQLELPSVLFAGRDYVNDFIFRIPVGDGM